MNEAILFLLLAAICLLFGAFLGNYFARLKHKSETEKLEERLQNTSFQSEKFTESLGSLNSQNERLRDEKEQLNIKLSQQSTEYDALFSELQREKERSKNFE